MASAHAAPGCRPFSLERSRWGWLGLAAAAVDAREASVATIAGTAKVSGDSAPHAHAAVAHQSRSPTTLHAAAGAWCTATANVARARPETMAGLTLTGGGTRVAVRQERDASGATGATEGTGRGTTRKTRARRVAGIGLFQRAPRASQTGAAGGASGLIAQFPTSGNAGATGGLPRFASVAGAAGCAGCAAIARTIVAIEIRSKTEIYCSVGVVQSLVYVKSNLLETGLMATFVEPVPALRNLVTNVLTLVVWLAAAAQCEWLPVKS